MDMGSHRCFGCVVSHDLAFLLFLFLFLSLLAKCQYEHGKERKEQRTENHRAHLRHHPLDEQDAKADAERHK